MKYPAIPDPQTSTEALYTTVRALKIAVEMLTGQRAGGRSAECSVQEAAPTNAQTGDFWVQPSAKNVLRYWNGNQWVVIAGSAYP